jgi:hypothetical protein
MLKIENDGSFLIPFLLVFWNFHKHTKLHYIFNYCLLKITKKKIQIIKFSNFIIHNIFFTFKHMYNCKYNL